MQPELRLDPAADDAARSKLLRAEARLRSVGGLWSAAGAAEGPLLLGCALLAFASDPNGAGAWRATMFLFLAAQRVMFVIQGLRMRNLDPGNYGLVKVLALLGVCAGPCGLVSWVVPFLVLGDAREVLTTEHAALRARTPHLTAPTSRFGMVAVAIAFLQPLVAVLALGWCMGAIEE